MNLSALNDVNGTAVDDPNNLSGTALGQAAGTEYLYRDAASPNTRE